MREARKNLNIASVLLERKPKLSRDEAIVKAKVDAALMILKARDGIF